MLGQEADLRVKLGQNRTKIGVDHEFENENKIKPEIAWNGGYILNPELVGKLGLPETYIGSPLGLIISDGRVLSLPLFNKAAMLISVQGLITIKRVNVSGGFDIFDNNTRIVFPPEAYNNRDKNTPLAYFDLMSDSKEIPGKGRVIVRLAGTRVKEIVKNSDKVQVIPVGLTLSFRQDMFPGDLVTLEKNLGFSLSGFEGIEHAVEAGPMLLSNGKMDINKNLLGE